MALQINQRAQSSGLLSRWRMILVSVVLIALIAFYIIANIYSPSFPAVATAMKGQSASDILESSTAEEMGNRLYIPQINVSVPIETGSAADALKGGAWQKTPELGNPKVGGNFALGAPRFEIGLTPAHTINQSPFYNVDTLKKGDEVYVDFEGERFGYKVEKLERDINESRVNSIEAKTDKPTMTLYTVTNDGVSDRSVVVTASFLGRIEEES